MTASVYAGAVAPETYTLTVSPGTSGVDLSTVTAASFMVVKAGGTSATWTATRSGQSSASVTLTYTFQSGDLATPGVYAIYAALTIPSGTVRTQPKQLIVKGQYETS